MKDLLNYQNELLDQVRSTLEVANKKEHVQNIIMDAVIFQRVTSGMDRLLKAYDPAAESWEPANEYFGIYNTFHALGIFQPEDFENEKVYLALTDPLLKIFDSVVEQDLPEHSKTAEDLAKHILLEWESFVNKVRFGKITIEP